MFFNYKDPIQQAENKWKIIAGQIGVDNFSIITPLLLDFCCPFLDELQKLMIKFTTGVKRYEQKIKDVGHLFAFELVNDYSVQLAHDSSTKPGKH